MKSVKYKMAPLHSNLVLLFFSLAILAASATAEDKGAIRQRELVLGGKNATPNKYNFYVQMERGCGAALITSDLIITAAHCLQTPNASNLVHVGAYQSLIGMQRNVTAVGVHPEYSAKTMKYDLMIMKLSEPVNNVSPVQLNIAPEVPAVGETLTVVGMGAVTPSSTKGFSLLQEGNIMALNATKCSIPYGKLWQGEESMLCAGNAEEGVDSCRGDSGGPLLDENNILVGVISVGMTCGDKNFPGIYARISSSAYWIYNQICLMTDFPPDFCPSNNNSVTVTVTRPVFNISVSSSTNTNGTQLASEADGNAGQRTGLGIRLEIMHDAYAIENRWELRNTNQDEIIDKADYYSVQEPGLVENTYTNLPAGNYEFNLQDMANDGICCTFGEGYIKIYDISHAGNATAMGDLIWYQPGNFTSEVSHTFRLGNTTEIDDDAESEGWVSFQLNPNRNPETDSETVSETVSYTLGQNP